MNKLQDEIKRLHERAVENGQTSKSLKDFAKLYQETQTTNTDALFSRIAKVKELNKEKSSAPMSFDAKPATSNLTSDQQKAFAEERSALGIPVTSAKEKHSKQTNETRIEKYRRLRADYGQAMTISPLAYFLPNIQNASKNILKPGTI